MKHETSLSLSGATVWSNRFLFSIIGVSNSNSIFSQMSLLHHQTSLKKNVIFRGKTCRYGIYIKVTVWLLEPEKWKEKAFSSVLEHFILLMASSHGLFFMFPILSSSSITSLNLES